VSYAASKMPVDALVSLLRNRSSAVLTGIFEGQASPPARTSREVPPKVDQILLHVSSPPGPRTA
jgi:hypothetical protein